MPLIGTVLGILLASMPGPTYAQLRFEMRPVETVTLTAQQFLTGDKSGKPATVAGELRIPRPGADKLPAVILLHGGAGIQLHHDRWAQELSSIGVATFLLDSFSGRGVANCNPSLCTVAIMIDAYRALDSLAQHPRIDPNRIAVMGFSIGALAAVYSSNERFRKMHGSPNVEFAAHIGLYTPCHITYRDDGKVTGKPIRLFHGIADDWGPIEPCRAYVARLKNSGADVVLTEYPGATHVFDAFYLKQATPLPQVQAPRQCLLAEGDNGEILNSKTGKRYDLNDPCMEKGVTIQYNEEATAATTKAVKEFLTTTLSR
jgi:dienelactone hydrolase